MSATEELRRLLDERGVEWIASGTDTCWKSSDGYPMRAWDTTNGTHMRVTDLTPEQAIAATLAAGECEFIIEDNMNETEGMGDVWFRCTNCGTTYDYYADDWLLRQNYCPNCGYKIRKAVEQ